MIKGIVLGIVLLTSSMAFAQNGKILVANSSSSGTYATMTDQLKQFCNDSVNIEVIKNSGGATGNLEALVNNKASVAWLHSDVIYAMSQSDPKYKALKTLIALYPEDIHIITRRDSGLKTGSYAGFGGHQVVFTDLSSFKGFKIGAAGGGVFTARILAGQGEAGFSVVQYDKGDELLPALGKGEVQAVIFVGGAPLANVEALNGNQYKLIPINESVASRLTTVYHSSVINYSNLRSGNIRTLAPDAIILTRKYTRPQMIAPQRALRQCFYEHLGDLQEEPGLHPKWQVVDKDNHGTWDWYEIPADASTPPVMPAIVKKRPIK